MLVKLSGRLCRVLLSKHMMWAWKFWWIESARVGTDCHTYVHIHLNNSKRKQERMTWI
jgi:hypothetical protein